MESNLAFMIFGIFIGFSLACLAFTIAADHFFGGADEDQDESDK